MKCKFFAGMFLLAATLQAFGQQTTPSTPDTVKVLVTPPPVKPDTVTQPVTAQPEIQSHSEPSPLSPPPKPDTLTQPITAEPETNAGNAVPPMPNEAADTLVQPISAQPDGAPPTANVSPPAPPAERVVQPITAEAESQVDNAPPVNADADTLVQPVTARPETKPVPHLPSRLDNTEWRLTQIGVEDLKMESLQTIPTIHFDSTGRVEGHGGVNGYSGDYKITGDSLVITSILATKMSGGRERDNLEQDFFNALGETNRYEITDKGELNLLNGRTVMLRFRPKGIIKE